MSDDFESFDEFWAHYLAEHSKPLTRVLHALGTGGALASVAAALYKKDPKYLLLAPLLGYGPSWLGHLLVEGNKPATFDHPLWSLGADAKMLKMMATGELEEEYRRLLGSETTRKHLLEAIEEAERMSE